MGLEKLGIRTLVTVFFGPLIILSAWLGGFLFLGVIAIIVIFAMYEFFNLAANKGANPLKTIGIISGTVLCIIFFFNQLHNSWILVSGAFLVMITVELFRDEDGPILNVATTLLGVFYISLPFGFLILVRELPNVVNLPYTTGGSLIILIFLAIWVCDSAAYILGSRFGKHKLFVRVSPNKTIEGTAFGFIFALLVAYLCQITFLKEVKLIHVLAIGAICGSFGQVSDLIESLFKRDAKVKDSSNIIPGHGGVLDRFDSEILVAPIVYFYLSFVVY